MGVRQDFSWGGQCPYFSSRLSTFTGGPGGTEIYLYIDAKAFWGFQISDFGDFETCEMVQLKK